MTLARFFERTFAAVGRHLAVDRETLESRLESITVGVACGDSSHEGNDQTIAQLVVNLLARLYPRVTLDGPVDVVEHLATLARSINPNIEIAETDATTWIAIDRHVEGARNVCPRASGWLAAVSATPMQPRGPLNPYAAATAACLAVSEVFRSFFVPSWEQKTYLVSLLDYSSQSHEDIPLQDAHLGAISVVGLGAVGNSAIWTLSKDASISADLTIVEPELVELSNLQRYVLTDDSDPGRAKTELARRTLPKERFQLELVPTRLESCGPLSPTVLVSVDNVVARRCVQALLPRLVINGWTSDSGLGASWHRFEQDAACLACLYQPHGQAPSQTDLAADALRIEPARAALLWINGAGIQAQEMKEIAARLGVEYKRLRPWVGKPIQALYSGLICGHAGVDIKGVGQLEAVPLAHQSVLAGVLAAVELRKRLDARLAERAQAEVLVAWFDILRGPPTHWTAQRARVPGCICGDATYREVFERKWNLSDRSSQT